jgi:predicted 2-oxoglutarate/Fe(II)-dependent dioxygenase YbiX
MVAHKDFGDSGTNTSIVFGVVVYLNNDFNGGEIFYKDLNLKVKPTPGSLLVHTSDILHEVLPVTNGERYSISTFIKGDKETSFIFK